MTNKKAFFIIMSLEIKYLGNLGNNLFQYCTSIIFTKNNNLFLETKISDKFKFLKPANFKQPKNFKLLDRYKQLLIKDIDFDLDKKEYPYSGYRRYKFRGYYQNTIYLNRYQDIILNIFKEIRDEYIKTINKNDILILIRTGEDFFHQYSDSEVLDPKYYLDILEKETFNNCYIYIYPQEDYYSKLYLELFDKYNPTIIKQSEDPLENFVIPFKFNKIICSNSTFHWWGCYLSESKIIYIPKLFGYFGTDIIRKHNDYYYEITNIRDRSIIVTNKFIEKEDLKLRTIIS